MRVGEFASLRMNAMAGRHAYFRNRILAYSRTRPFAWLLGQERMDSLGATRRVKLTLQYDGAGFFGWQVQPGVRTVQAELEAALSRLTDGSVTVIAAGRTDRGVHATGQVASALVPEKWTPAALLRSLNAILPPDIWIMLATEVQNSFHARYDAVARSYTYRVGTSAEAASPFRRRWC